MKFLDESFDACNVSNDGLLKRDELKAYLLLQDEKAVKEGLKWREVTDEIVDMMYECCN